MPPADAIAEFAKAHGLAFAEHGSLPRQGSTLERDTRQVLGAATGKLPGGIEGTLAHYTYTYTTTPRGPIAESELEAEPQGLTAKDLDMYLEQPAGEVKEAPAAPAG